MTGGAALHSSGDGAVLGDTTEVSSTNDYAYVAEGAGEY
jgi:hypothetical protein